MKLSRGTGLPLRYSVIRAVYGGSGGRGSIGHRLGQYPYLPKIAQTTNRAACPFPFA